MDNALYQTQSGSAGYLVSVEIEDIEKALPGPLAVHNAQEGHTHFRR